MRSRTRHAIIGVVVFVVVVGLLVGGSALLGTLAALVTPVDDTTAPTYDTDELRLEKIEATGEVDVLVQEPGVVVIDRAHANEFENRDIRELTAALVRAGHEVRTVDRADAFDEALANADALVVIDPQESYTAAELNATAAFAEDGGRILLLGQPDRVALEGQTAVPRRSEIDSIANRFGISFGTDHLYDMEANDGNHRNVVLSATEHGLVADVDTAVVSIGTHVSAVEGEPLLVTEPSARRAKGGTRGEYTVATLSGNVLAVGDADFLRGERYNVADNNEFIASVVAFLSGEDG